MPESQTESVQSPSFIRQRVAIQTANESSTRGSDMAISARSGFRSAFQFNRTIPARPESARSRQARGIPEPRVIGMVDALQSSERP